MTDILLIGGSHLGMSICSYISHEDVRIVYLKGESMNQQNGFDEEKTMIRDFSQLISQLNEFKINDNPFNTFKSGQELRRERRKHQRSNKP